MVDRDTEEWRRPWVDEPVTARVPAVGSDTLPLGTPPPSGTARVDTRPLDLADHGDPAPAGDDPGPRDDDPADGATAPAAGPAVPADWSAAHDGPGSPTGSVRPPDTTGTVEPPRADRRRRLVVPLVAALVGSAIGTGTTLAVLADDTPRPTVTDVREEPEPVRVPLASPTEDAPDEVVPGEDAGTIVSRVAAAVLPSVVNIDVFALEEQDPAGRTQLGLGSGVVYRSDGYVLTNNHVVADADVVEVRFSDGVVAEAEVVGADRLTDLAVLLVDDTGLPAVNLRETPLEVGETAVAIGSPFGLDASVTAGIVSAVNRNLEVPPTDDEAAFVIPAVIQTDAAINPGNSGGALVDREGRLIGINTAILTRSGGSQGVGFAIPVKNAVDAADQLIANGFVSHPFLGMSGEDVTAQVAERYRRQYAIELDGGAVVREVVDDSGADLGGLRVDDVVVRIGDEQIRTMEDVIVAVRSFAPGEVVEIEVLRAGDRQTLDVTLGERPRP